MFLDMLLIGAVVAASCGFYVSRIGFYSDDWFFLATMNAAPDQSVVGLFRALLTPQVAMRPLQLLELALLYRAFGTNPLGYHLVNSALLVLCGLLLYTAMRELRGPRTLAIAVALVYSTLPHYSSNHFMMLTFQISLSMALYGLSVLASLRVLSARRYRWWGWLVVALLCLVASGLAYEIALPLFLLTPPLLWYIQRRAPNDRQPRTALRLWMLAALTTLTFVGVMLYKLRVTVRLGTQPLSEQLLWIMRRAVAPRYAEYTYGLNIGQAFRIAYGDYGIGLPRLLAQIVREYFDGSALLLSALVGLVVLVGVWRAAATDAPLSRRAWLALAAMGIVVFAGGYAIFLTNWNVGFSPTGIANRTAMAAALGVALTFVGIIGWCCSLIRAARVQRGLFASLIALVCASNLLVTLTIANFWIAAHQQQQRTLDAITHDLPQVPDGKAILLEGACAYAGPAPVFEAPWDLSSALQLRYQTPIRADMVTTHTAVEGDGLANGLYGVVTRYPYDQFVIYNATYHKISKIDDLNEAKRHFARYNPDRSSGCLSGVEGHGVAVWDNVRERVQPQP